MIKKINRYSAIDILIGYRYILQLERDNYIGREYINKGNFKRSWELINYYLTNKSKFCKFLILSYNITKLNNYGGLIFKAYWKNGKLNGKTTIWWANGKVCIERWNKNGLLHGLVKQYTETGILSKIEKYENGKKIEIW